MLCFHPYKAVLAITEDLRTHLKSEKGRTLVSYKHGENRPISGQDLKPMHDAAQGIVNDVIISDIPLLYTPGQVGMAALMVANQLEQEKTADSTQSIPQIDLIGYIGQRFERDTAKFESMASLLKEICSKLRLLKEGKYGCGNYEVDMAALKGIHKKLKKVRVWGKSEKKKKRKGGDDDDNDNEGEDGTERPKKKSKKT
ncbi:MAG: hypothetical protein SGARI_006336 [Bacillariaceae sp.]